MLHINATAYGGGVAEILQNLVPLLRDAGVDAHWAVLDAPAAFYEEHDAAIWTMPQFVRPDLKQKVLIRAPTIDPFSLKNQDMPADEAREVVRRFRVAPGRPILLQVSRFDPWKDPLGVIDAYRLVKGEVPGVQLVMIGSLADDDPEGQE